MGSRVIELGNPIVYIEREDLQHSALRLKEFGDFDIDGKVATFVSKKRTDKRKIIHWVSQNSSDSAELEIVKDGELISIEGKLESHQIKLGTSVQLERIGYGIVAEKNKVIFTHN